MKLKRENHDGASQFAQFDAGPVEKAIRNNLQKAKAALLAKRAARAAGKPAAAQ